MTARPRRLLDSGYACEHVNACMQGHSFHSLSEAVVERSGGLKCYWTAELVCSGGSCCSSYCSVLAEVDIGLAGRVDSADGGPDGGVEVAPVSVSGAWTSSVH